MNVLFFSPTPINSHNDIKGTGNWVGSLLQSINRYDSVIKEITVAFHDKTINKIQASNVGRFKVYKLPTNALSTNFGKLFDNWTTKDIYKDSLSDYLEVINEVKPDIIQLFGIEHPYIRILGETKIPVVIHLQGLLSPSLYHHYKSFSFYEKLFSGKASTFLKGANPFLGKKRVKKHLKLEREIYQDCDYFFGRTDWDRLFTKAVATDSEYFTCNELLRENYYNHEWNKEREKNKLIILTTTKEGPYKNADLIYEAAHLLENITKYFNFEWRVMGITEHERSMMVAKKRGKYSEKVKLLGRVDSQKMAQEMLNADLFVYPSNVDNSPNALQEALLVGMPVIASNAGGIPSFIEHGKTGYLIPSGDPYATAGAIIDLKNNFDLAQKMGAAARKAGLKRNDPKNVVQSLVSSFQKIIEKHKLK